jgi:hypothetical protein
MCFALCMYPLCLETIFRKPYMLTCLFQPDLSCLRFALSIQYFEQWVCLHVNSLPCSPRGRISPESSTHRFGSFDIPAALRVPLLRSRLVLALVSLLRALPGLALSSMLQSWRGSWMISKHVWTESNRRVYSNKQAIVRRRCIHTLARARREFVQRVQVQKQVPVAVYAESRQPFRVPPSGESEYVRPDVAAFETISCKPHIEMVSLPAQKQARWSSLHRPV